MEDDMMERLLATLLAGALVAPQMGMASESGFNNEGGRQAVSKFPEKLPLPPVPCLPSPTSRPLPRYDALDKS